MTCCQHLFSMIIADLRELLGSLCTVVMMIAIKKLVSIPLVIGVIHRSWYPQTVGTPKPWFQLGL